MVIDQMVEVLRVLVANLCQIDYHCKFVVEVVGIVVVALVDCFQPFVGLVEMQVIVKQQMDLLAVVVVEMELGN